MSAMRQAQGLLILGGGVGWMALDGSTWLPKELVEYGLAYTGTSAHVRIASSCLSFGFYEPDSPDGLYHLLLSRRDSHFKSPSESVLIYSC